MCVSHLFSEVHCVTYVHVHVLDGLCVADDVYPRSL